MKVLYFVFFCNLTDAGLAKKVRHRTVCPLEDRNKLNCFSKNLNSISPPKDNLIDDALGKRSF